MTRTPRVGHGLRALALGALALLGIAAAAVPARADVCFGGGGGEPEPQDAGQGDGATMGALRGSAPRRTAGAGLVLVAGLGGAWLGTRRKSDDRGDDDRGAPLR